MLEAVELMTPGDEVQEEEVEQETVEEARLVTRSC